MRGARIRTSTSHGCGRADPIAGLPGCPDVAVMARHPLLGLGHRDAYRCPGPGRVERRASSVRGPLASFPVCQLYLGGDAPPDVSKAGAERLWRTYNPLILARALTSRTHSSARCWAWLASHWLIAMARR